MIPFNALDRSDPALLAACAAALDRVLRSGWYVLGPEVQSFEAAFAEFCRVEHCIGVASGSDALELALRALGVGPGQRVGLVANAAAYGSLAVRAVGAEPVYLDVEPGTLNLAPAALVARIDGLAAVIVTHLYGRLAAIEEIVAVARAHGVAVIEDCAQAHGAERGGIRAGGFGDLGCFSFYPTKNLGAVGDGGAIVTRRADLAQVLRELRTYGWTEKYCIRRPGGRNCRLDALQAAVLGAKLPYWASEQTRRRALAEQYLQRLRRDHPRWRVLPRGADDDVLHLFVIQSPERERLRAHLRARGIGHDVHYPIPDHRQPIWAAEFAGLTLPVTERACAEVLSLPLFPGLTEAEVDTVCQVLNDYPEEAAG